jgi:transposase
MKQHHQGTEFAAFIGIDWADRKHFVSLAAAGQAVERYELEQQPEAIAQWLSNLQQRFPGQRLALALELSRGPLIYALMSYEFLVLYPVNPKALARYREAFYVSGAKDDPVDADLLRELVTLHRDKLRAWQPDDELTRTITLLVEYRRALVASRTRLTNQLSSLLKLYYPQALAWAGELATVQACDFLQRWPTLAKVQRVSASKLRQFYQAHGGRKAALIEQRLQQIAVAQPLTADGAVLTATVPMMLATLGQLRPVRQAIKDMDQQLQELFAQHADHDLFSSLPGAGPVLAPRLLAAFGADRDRFSSAQEVQQFSGIAPVLERSGKSCWVHRRFACPKFLRQSFHEYAAQSIRWSPWARACYQQLRQRGQKHHAAVRTLAFKWIRIIFRCWQTRRPYSEDFYQQALRQRGSALTNLLVAPGAAGCSGASGD